MNLKTSYTADYENLKKMKEQQVSRHEPSEFWLVKHSKPEIKAFIVNDPTEEEKASFTKYTQIEIKEDPITD